MNIDSNEILVKQILNICFPVGKIEIFYDNLDHSNYMGFKWQRCLSERSPIGYNPSSADSYKTIGSQFGEKRHTLTTDEIPEHKHITTISNKELKGSANFRRSGSAASHWDIVVHVAGILSKDSNQIWAGSHTLLANSGNINPSYFDQLHLDASHNHTATVNNTGGSQSHNNIHPVEVVAFWRRIS